MLQDANEFVKKCENYQRFENIQHLHAVEMTSITSPWPFSQWRIDLLGLFPEGKGQTKYVVIAINYLTKWAEAEALARIISFQIQTFVWKNIICIFGLPRVIILDNGMQFECKSFEEFCEGHGI